MSLIIASQLDAEFNHSLASHPSKPTIVEVPIEAPWSVAEKADILLAGPFPGWHDAPGGRPLIWPGRLKWVYSVSAGVDAYPRWLLNAPLVTCGRGVASEEIADYVIAALFRKAKNLDAVAVRGPADWGYAALGQIQGATVGIIGLGAIGQAVARRCLALGMRVIGIRRSAARSEPGGIEIVADTDRLAVEADHIVLAVPATQQTRHLVGKAFLNCTKADAHLINVSRGSVVDQDALLGALDNGRLGFATLDVTEPEPLPEGHPLYSHSRVLLTPHVASNYNLVRPRLLAKIHDDLSRFLRGDRPSDIVDPERGY